MSGDGIKAPCRDSQTVETPATKQADLITSWGKSVDASSTPLKKYPRPQMVRTMRSRVESMASLRDDGIPETWVNLNGLWEFEPAHEDDVPPFGKTLNGSILVPFPVESCLSGVAPESSDEAIQRFWYRLVFDAPSLGRNGNVSRTILRFGAIDWQSQVFLNGAKLGAMWVATTASRSISLLPSARRATSSSFTCMIRLT